MKRYAKSSVVFLLCVGTAACQPKPEVLDPQLTDLDSVPSTTLHAADVNDVPTLVATHEVEVPGNGTQSLLTRIEGLDVNDAGEVTVPDGQTHYVRVFDRSGKLLRQFGGRGDGPGELRRPYLLTSHKDTLYVVDERGINRFTHAGEYVGRATFEMISNLQGRSYAQHFPRSVAIARGRAVISEVPVRMQSPDTTFQTVTQLRFVELSTGVIGEPFQRIPSQKFYPVVSSAEWKARFGAESKFVVLPDASVVVAGLEGRTLNVFADGRLTRRVVLDVPRREVKQQELDSLLAHRERGMRSEMAATRAFREYPKDFIKTSLAGTKRLPYFKFHPAVGRMIASEEGRLLVNRPDLSAGSFGLDEFPGKTVWNVFDSDLRPIGKVEFPAGFTPVAFHGDMVAGTTKDSLDVPSISGYRIAKPAR